MKYFNAKAEARRRNGQDRLNNDETFEVAYSALFHTIEPNKCFRIFNTNYPFSSVGVSYSKGENGRRRFH